MAALVVGVLLIPAVGRPAESPQPPPTPTSVGVISSSPTSLRLSWRAGVRGPARAYEVSKDGSSIGRTERTTFVVAGLRCGTAYTLTVEALDDAGRRSEGASVTAASDPCPEASRGAGVSTSPPAQQSGVTPRPPEQPSSPSMPSGSRPATSPVHPAAVPHVGGTATGMPWSGAGAFVWQETDVAPESLGTQLRDSGFSWVAVFLHDGVDVDPIEGDWVRRFREASGLLVGGWGVLRAEPEQEAELAHRLLGEYSLDFYIANPEAEYKLSDDFGPSEERYGRSQRFVEAFRALEPDTPAAMSSYCRADRADIDWDAWHRSGFVFMPQAYVNDFGAAASPASCAAGAAKYFPARAVHPTVGVYAGQEEDEPSAERYAALLAEAGTVGFSVYLAETRMQHGEWRTFGAAIDELAIARPKSTGLAIQRDVVERDDFGSAE